MTLSDRLSVFPDRAGWLAARRSTIGGSDVPVILGLSSYKTPLQLWTEKVGLVAASETDDSTYSQRRGHAIEPFLASELERDVGLVVRTQGHAIVRHATIPEFAYSPDGFCLDNSDTPIALAEFKSRAWGKKEWDEEIPEDVFAQVQHGLDVCDLLDGFVIVDLGSESRWARVRRDDGYIEEMRPQLLEFARRVREEDPPPATGEAGDKQALESRFPRETKGKSLALPADAVDWTEKYMIASAALKEATVARDEAANKIREMLGDAEAGFLVGMGEKARWSWAVQQRKEYMVPASESRVLRLLGVEREV